MSKIVVKQRGRGAGGQGRKFAPPLPRSSAPLLLLLLLFFSSCASTAPVVKIGLVAPFEGRDRAIGYEVIYGARLAVREINAAGGIGGYQVALVALDDSGTNEFAAETATSLIIDPAVVAVIGHWLPETTAVVTSLYANANLYFLPEISPSTNPITPAFYEAYSSVTPFDEEPTGYSLAAYEAMGEVFMGMETAVVESGTINRQTMNATPQQAD